MTVEQERLSPALPAPIQAAITAYPAQAKALFGRVRDLIFSTAETLPDAIPLKEDLKWGEPSFLNKNGTTIRVAWSEKRPDTLGLFVNCQTTLVEDWRARYGGDLTFIGNREIRLPLDAPLPHEPLRHCVAMALTYHARKKAKS